jgi:hypothetical protein
MLIRFTPASFPLPVHFVVKVAFGYIENAVFLFKSVLHSNEFLHLGAEKFMHLHGAVAFLGFRISNHILPL